MSNEMIPFALREEELELVVSEKTLGSLTTNARQIKELVERALPMYDAANYDASNIDAAKKDKAMLNNVSKALNARRIELEKEFMKPFTEFKAIVGETVDLIKTASGRIDDVVKVQEQREKDAKREQIAALWDASGSPLVALDRIFRSTWLNKTVPLKAIDTEVKEIVAKIDNDIATIEAIGEDVDLLKGLYLDTLDLNRTIQYARTLKDNRERAKAEAERKAAEEGRRAAEAERKAAEVVTRPAEPVAESPAVEDVPTAPAPAATSKPELYTRAFRVTTTKENIIALANFMKARGIVFERVDAGNATTARVGSNA